jgi:hypothetical protein
VTVSIKDPKKPDEEPVIEELPSGFTLWSTGIAMNPFTKTVVEKLPNQFHRKAVEVDQHLRVRGAPPGTVYAIGDASTVRPPTGACEQSALCRLTLPPGRLQIETRLVNHLLEIFDECDSDKDNKINYAEWEKLAGIMRSKFPLAEKHFTKMYVAGLPSVVTLSP